MEATTEATHGRCSVNASEQRGVLGIFAVSVNSGPALLFHPEDNKARLPSPNKVLHVSTEKLD